MEIIKTMGNLTKGEMFNMTQGQNLGKVSDRAGEVIKVNSYIIYEDVDQDGDIQKILVFKDENGELSATISKTFIEQFEKLVDFMGEEEYSIQVIGKKSKNGRDYITCAVVQ